MSDDAPRDTAPMRLWHPPVGGIRGTPDVPWSRLRRIQPPRLSYQPPGVRS